MASPTWLSVVSTDLRSVVWAPGSREPQAGGSPQRRVCGRATRGRTSRATFHAWHEVVMEAARELGWSFQEH